MTESRLFYGVPTPTIPDLVGRDQLLAKIRRQLAGQSNIALTGGLPGAGKTALALALVNDPAVRRLCPDGVLWLSVGKDLTHWLNRISGWATRLGIPQDRVGWLQENEGSTAVLDEISEALADRPVLLVFDDVWKKEEAFRFARIGARCRRVLTTRLLDVGREFLGAGSTTGVEELDPESSTELLTRLAPDVVADHGEKVAELIKAIGGVPLALVIVGRSLQDRYETRGSPAAGALLDQVMQADELLRLEGSYGGDLSGDPSRRRSLQAVIELTAEELTPDQRDALRALSAFPPKANDFSQEAGAAVAGGPDHVERLRLTGLLDLHDPRLGRLTMHQAIADYARAGRGGDEAAYRRMLEYFLAYIDEQTKNEPDQEKWQQSLELEQENIRAVFAWVEKVKDGTAGMRLMSALWPYFYRRSRFRRGLRYARLVLGYSTDDQILRAKVLNDAGNYAYNLADLTAAEDLHGQALDIRLAAGREDLAAGSWNNLGLVERERDHNDAARALFQQALEANRRLDNRAWEAMNLNNLGLTAGRERDHAAAEQYQRDSHAAFQDLNDRWGMAMTDVDRASALIELERFAEADALLRSAVRDRWAARDDKAVAAALRGLARLALGEERAAEARELLGTAMALSREVTDRLGQGQALELLTRVGAAQGDVDLGATALGALRAYRRATGVTLPAWREERLQAAEQRLADAFGAGRVQELVEARLAHVPRTEDGDLQLDESGPWDSDAAPGSVIEPLLAG